MHTTQKVLITGANRGIGYETAKRLKELNFTVILSARDRDKGRTAFPPQQAAIKSALATR